MRFKSATRNSRYVSAITTVAPILLFPAVLIAFVSGVSGATSGIFNRQASLEERWGIKIEGVRLSAGGYMLDFRYRVLNAAKALPLTEPSLRPYLVHNRTGMKLMVPAPGKVGPLRNTSRNGAPKEGNVYFVLFANPGKTVRAGDAVAVTIGGFKAEGAAELTVKG